MMATLNHTHTIYQNEAAASAVAASMQAGDDDWTYKVIPDPKGSGRAIIAMYDEAGEFVENV